MQTTDIRGLEKMYDNLDQPTLERKLLEAVRDPEIDEVRVFLNRRERRKQAAEERKTQRRKDTTL